MRCFSESPTQAKQCRKCAESFTRENPAYRVRVKVAGRWKTATLGSLKEAREFEEAYGVKDELTQKVRQRGRPRQLTKTVGNKPEAKSPELQGLTLKDVWEKFYVWAKSNLKHPDSYESIWRNRLAEAFGDRALSEISANDIVAFFQTLQTEPRKPRPWHKPDKTKTISIRTSTGYIKLIGRLFSYAIEQCDYQGANPFDRVTLPSFDNQMTNDLKAGAVKRLVGVLDSWGNRSVALAFKLCLMTGKRSGEVFGLTWDRVDFDDCFIRFFVKSKKRNQAQNYPMSPGVKALLQDALKLSVKGSGLVFTTKAGKRICYRSIWLRIKKRANLPEETRPHDLRHTFASRLLSSGKVDIYQMQKLLGHKDIRMTERYSHLADETLRKAAQSADEIFG